MYGYSDSVKPDLQINKETEAKENINSLIDNVKMEQEIDSGLKADATTSTPYIANTDVVCSLSSTDNF